MYELYAFHGPQPNSKTSSIPTPAGIMVPSASQHPAPSLLEDGILPSLPSLYSPSSRPPSPAASLDWDYLELAAADEDESCVTLPGGPHALASPLAPLAPPPAPPAVDELLFPAMDLAPCAVPPPPPAALPAYDEPFASLVLPIAASTVPSSIEYSDPVAAAMDAATSAQRIADAVESSSQYSLASYYEHHGRLAAVTRTCAPLHQHQNHHHCVAAAHLRSPTAQASVLSPTSVSSGVDAFPVAMHLMCPAASSPSPPSSTARKSRPATSDGSCSLRHGPAAAAAPAKIALVKQRRRYNQPRSSKYCHLCARHERAVEMVSCGNLYRGLCQKSVCRKCFSAYALDWDAAREAVSSTATGVRPAWLCPHCVGNCPKRAKCFAYDRQTVRRRVKTQEARCGTSSSATGGIGGAPRM